MERNTPFEKMRMESADLISQNVEKIAELFPECVTEGADQDGKIRRLVDFDKLREVLSGDIAEEPERYDLNWVGKSAALAESNTSIRKTLRPYPEESRDWETTQNLYIEGDNIDVLKLLLESYLGKVNVIYIDPPYNTGSDSFIYPDNYRADDDEYETQGGFFDENGNKVFKENNDTNPRFHSDWCSMIYSRLRLASSLLSEDGVILVSIDYNENFNLRQIMNEVFGASSFIGEIYWESKTKSQNTSTSFNKLQPKAEMIYVYSKQPKRRFNLIKKNEKTYPCSDEKGVYREYPLEVMNALGQRGRETMIFDISDGVSTVSLPVGKQWQLGQAQVATYKDEGNLFIRDGKVIIKMRPEFERSETTEPFWGFFSKEIGTAESAKKELTSLVPNHSFETVKPVELIKRLIYHCSQKDSLVLDFFSGTATTAHAVMQLNAEDDGSRHFIMVQLPEICDPKSEAAKSGYSTICEIGKERIRRAGDKIKKEHQLTIQNLDVGFRVLKVDSTNMNDVYYGASEVSQDLIKSTESNIKDDRTDLDLLFGCLIDWGVPLSYPYKSEEICGATVHDYNDGDLIACFAENVSQDVVEEIARRKPTRAVFRDSCFASDAEKINVTELFKRYSPDTRIKTI